MPAGSHRVGSTVVGSYGYAATNPNVRPGFELGKIDVYILCVICVYTLYDMCIYYIIYGFILTVLYFTMLVGMFACEQSVRQLWTLRDDGGLQLSTLSQVRTLV